MQYFLRRNVGLYKKPERDPSDKEHDYRVLQPRDYPSFSHLACDQAREYPLDHGSMREYTCIKSDIEILNELG